VKTEYIPGLRIKTGILLFALLCPGLVFCQTRSGQVLSSETKSGIAYVNVGIIGKNIGTVTNEYGNFTITLDKINNTDSLRFSMIGYESKSFLVSQFKEDSIKDVYLVPRSYYLTEVKVFSHRTHEIRLGTPVLSDALKSGFESNDLGSEMGIKVNARKQVVLKEININVATCTFDSVVYRINIYQVVNKTEYKNILIEPIYISFSKDKIDKVITLNLRKYSIQIEGEVLISLELFKDLGEGRLLFHTQYFTGITYHRKTSQGKWTEAPGAIGMYLYGQTTK
jgi:CarboxypepD_reg-like domain